MGEMMVNNCSVALENLTNPPTSCLQQADMDSKRVWDLVGVVYIVLVTLAAVVGNGALCWIILNNPSLRTISNRLVLNLAWCDLLTSILNAPFTLVVLVYRDWNMGHITCQVNGFLTTFLGIASVVTLAVISVNRYVVRPFWPQRNRVASTHYSSSLHNSLELSCIYAQVK